MHITVGIFNAKHQHCSIVEAADRVYPFGVGSQVAVLDLLLTDIACDFVNGKQCGTDRVVDDVALAKAEVNVRSLLCQDRGQQRTCSDQLEVYGSTADVFALGVGDFVGREVVVDQVSDNLRLVTAGSQPDLNCALLGHNGHGAHAVVVTEEGHDKALDLVPCGLEDICVCLHLIVIIGSVCAVLLAAADDEVVNLKGLCLSAGQERTQSTDIALELLQVLCDLVLIGTHLVQQLCYLLQSTYVGGLLSCHVGQSLSDRNAVLFGVVIVKSARLNDHVNQNVGHHAREAVIAVFVGSGTRQLNNFKVVIVDDVQDLLDLTDDIAHGTERNLESYLISGVCCQIYSVFLDLTVAVKLIGSKAGNLPVGIVVVLQSLRLCEGSAVVVAGLSCVKALAVQLQRTADEHTVQHVLSEAGDEIVHTRTVLGGGKGEFDPLTCSLPLRTANRVQHHAGGVCGRGHCTGSVLDRVDGLGGHVVHMLCFQLDLVLTCIQRAELSGQRCEVIFIGEYLLCGIQRDRLDDHRLVLALNGQLSLSCLEIELVLAGIVTGGVTQAVGDPIGILHCACTQLVLFNVFLEEADLLCIHKRGVRFVPDVGEFNGCINVVFRGDLAKQVLLDLFLHGPVSRQACSLSLALELGQLTVDFGRQIALGHIGYVLGHAVQRTYQIKTVEVLAGPDLGERQITRLTKGNLVVNFEDTLDGSCLTDHGVILDLDRISCALGYFHYPGNLALGRSEQALGYAVLVLVRKTDVLLAAFGDVAIGRIDRNGLRGLFIALARILCNVFAIRNCVQKLFDFSQRVLCFLRTDFTLGIIRSGDRHGSATNQESQSQNQSHQLSKFRFSHKISSYQDFL